MAMWLQKIILTVVAVVPVIVGEIVRATDDHPAHDVLVIAPGPAVDRHEPGLPSIAPSPSSALDTVRDATVRGC